MPQLPFVARVAVGATAIAAEEIGKLPSTIAALPKKFASGAAAVTVRINEDLNSLAERGDRAVSDNQQPADTVIVDAEPDSTDDAAAAS